MSPELEAELLTAGSVLPQAVWCPGCRSTVPAWPALAAELQAPSTPAERSYQRQCSRCRTLYTIDGLRASMPTRGEDLRWIGLNSTCSAVMLGCWVCAYSELWAAVLVALASAPALVLVWMWVRQSYRQHLVRVKEQTRRGIMALLGGGDAGLGARFYECDATLRDLVRQVADRELQLPALRTAHDKLAVSSFASRARSFEQAIELLTQQIAEREQLARSFVRYRLDLEALREAGQAQRQFELAPAIDDQDDLDAKRARLHETYDQLRGAAEVAAELDALGVGPVPG